MPKVTFLSWPCFVLATTLVAGAPPAVQTSDHCGMCHRDIYRSWTGSAHAESMESPPFLDAFRALEARNAAKAKLCLGCHAPMAELTDDADLTHKTTWEGITCSFCHSIVDVDMKGGNPSYRLELGDVMRGPIEDAEAMEHEVAYSTLHTESLVCAPCHEFSSSAGVPVLTTYSEWLDSGAADRGETCQSCHMALTRANVVDPRVLRKPSSTINLHDMPGGHSLQQLHKALHLSIDPRRHDENLEIAARIENRGAGHAVPTGLPDRRIILSITVDTSDGRRFEEERVFAKSFVGADGRTLTRTADHFEDGVRLQSDSRIAADEIREETFVFAVPAESTAWLTTKLHYEHAPQGPDQERVWITFFSERRHLERP